MKFVDTAQFKIKAGKGGDGAVSFLHELYVAKGGPNGGDGGKGGDVIFIADPGKASLLDLKLQRVYAAEDGGKGNIKNMHGANGADKVIRVPLGTVLIDRKTNEILADVSLLDEKYVLAKGGVGGRGNARFATSRNRTPTMFEAGSLGDEFDIQAELKMLADIGFVGLPNAGKSTLLRTISNSKVEVADYPFTTLKPQLGTVKAPDGQTFVVADLPGLIEGASLGRGLGHQFLKHIERCKIICHIIDWSGNYGQEDIVQNYELIRKELKNYNLNLDSHLEIIVANKMDLEIAQENFRSSKIHQFFKNKKIIYVSGLKKENIDRLLSCLAEEFSKAKDAPLLNLANSENKDYKVYRFDDTASDFEVLNLGNSRWEVRGEAVLQIYQRTPLTTKDNLLMFNEKMKKIGVYDELRHRGARAGDIVKIYNYELEWVG